MFAFMAKFTKERGKKVEPVEQGADQPKNADGAVLPPYSRLDPGVNCKEHEGPGEGEENTFGPEEHKAEGRSQENERGHRHAMQESADKRDARLPAGWLNLLVSHSPAGMCGG